VLGETDLDDVGEKVGKGDLDLERDDLESCSSGCAERVLVEDTACYIGISKFPTK
jgi:hypothetical protein